MLALALATGSYFLLVALSILNAGSDREAMGAAVMMLLFAGIPLNIALHIYHRDVLPGFFVAAWNAADAMKCEPRFVEACGLVAGDIIPDVAARMGLTQIVRAFKRATTQGN